MKGEGDYQGVKNEQNMGLKKKVKGRGNIHTDDGGRG